MAVAKFLRRLFGDDRGSMAIETAIVAPVLVLLSVGGFQVSAMVARQSELQSAAAEAEAIALAVHPETSEQIRTIEEVIMASAGLADANVTITTVFRCNSDANYVASSAACATSDEVSTFLQIFMTDTSNPWWTSFGVGEPLVYRLTRTVQLS